MPTGFYKVVIIRGGGKSYENLKSGGLQSFGDSLVQWQEMFTGDHFLATNHEKLLRPALFTELKVPHHQHPAEKCRGAVKAEWVPGFPLLMLDNQVAIEVLQCELGHRHSLAGVVAHGKGCCGPCSHRHGNTH